MEIGAVEDAEALADVAEADAFDVDVGHFLFGDADAVVFDFDVQAAVAIGGAKLDFSAVEFGSEAVFEAIFDDGLQKHAGDEGFERFIVDVLDDVEVVAAEAGDLDIEIVVDEFELFAQRHKRFVLAEQTAENVAELEHHAASVIGIEADERGDGVQRIEKKVRIDLAGERVHARFEQELLVALEVHLDARVVPDFQRSGHGHERGDDRQCRATSPIPDESRRAIWAWWPATSATRPSSSRTHTPSGAISQESCALFQEPHHGFRNVQKGEGPKVPEIFFVGDGLADQAAEQSRGRRGGHSEPLVGDQRGNGDNRSADGADDAAAEQAHQKSAFERKVGESVRIADEAERDADDERRSHEEHEL